MKTERLSERVLVVTGDYFDEHMTVVATDDGLVIVDTLATLPATRAALAVVQAFSGDAVRLVINTHPDVDHVAGNGLFPGARILGHSNCRHRWSAGDRTPVRFLREFLAALEAGAPPAHAALAARRQAYIAGYRHLLDGFDDMVSAPPTEFVADRARIDHGGVAFVLEHIGPGHTDADLAVAIPQENMLLTGDLVMGDGYTPVAHALRGGSLSGLLAALNRVEALAGPDTRLVPGHGAIGSSGLVAAPRHYLGRLLSAVADARAAGMTLDESKASVRVEAFEHHLLYDLVQPGHVEMAWELT